MTDKIKKVKFTKAERKEQKDFLKPIKKKDGSDAFTQEQQDYLAGVDDSGEIDIAESRRRMKEMCMSFPMATGV